MNAFATYGAQVTHAPPDRRHERRKKDPSALDLKLEERARLTRAYRALKRQERISILQQEPRLLTFMRYLRGVGPNGGDELLDAIEASDWLMRAPQNVRGFALQRIARRQDKIRLMMGERPLDDPIPPDTNVFFKAQNLLRRAGAL